VTTTRAITWCDTLAVFDLETTGIDVETARIVTATLAVLDADGVVQARTDWLVDPGIDIPEPASAVHGITTEHARIYGRVAADAVAEIVAAVRAQLGSGIPLVAYNAPYDLTVLNREARRYGIPPLEAPAPVIDPLVIDKAVDKYRRGKRTLTAAAEHYGVVLDAAHDAGADAIAAGHVAQAIARRFPAELALTVTELHERQIVWCAEHAESFQDYMRRTKDPTFTTSGAWPER
jgi:DNA polymerase III epsilon subunit-like protein